MVLSITDGHENSSSEFTLPIVRQIIEAHTSAGSTFVFLGRVDAPRGLLGDAAGSADFFEGDTSAEEDRTPRHGN